MTARASPSCAAATGALDPHASTPETVRLPAPAAPLEARVDPPGRRSCRSASVKNREPRETATTAEAQPARGASGRAANPVALTPAAAPRALYAWNDRPRRHAQGEAADDHDRATGARGSLRARDRDVRPHLPKSDDGSALHARARARRRQAR